MMVGRRLTVVVPWGQETHPLRHNVVTVGLWGGFGGTLGTGTSSLKAL